MLSYIYRLIRDFEQEHGMLPNLLYLNREHVNHLMAAFSDELSMQNIIDKLGMEVVMDTETPHPHVAWTSVAHHKLAS